MMVLFQRRDPTLAFVLKAVQEEHRHVELHGVKGAILTASIIFDLLKAAHARSLMDIRSWHGILCEAHWYCSPDPPPKNEF